MLSFACLAEASGTAAVQPPHQQITIPKKRMRNNQHASVLNESMHLGDVLPLPLLPLLPDNGVGCAGGIIHAPDTAGEAGLTQSLQPTLLLGPRVCSTMWAYLPHQGL